MNIGPSTSSPSSMHHAAAAAAAHHHHHHHQYGTSATDMSRSTFPSTYYDPFYANGTAGAWSAYPTSTYSAQAAVAVSQAAVVSSAAAAAASTCLLGPSGPKSLVNSHFTAVHSQRRKRRVLFTQAQVLTTILLCAGTTSRVLI